MPLNTIQRQILRQLVDIAVDNVINKNTIQWLKQCMTPCAITQEDLLKSFDPDYLQSIKDCKGVARNVRNAWIVFANWVNNLTSEIPNDSIELLKKHPNYNPYNLADLKQFETRCAEANVDENKTLFLLRLRELYFEMTPVD